MRHTLIFLVLISFSLLAQKEKSQMGITANAINISVVGNPVLSGSYPAAPGLS